ncbi:MAG: metal-dependent transcriptional regulator [Candidatus Lambdaproteobacteria bacterium]|nr:metal-dependent transcriptional regulator [Candidatus Lambdaproteobacteria bacterium]
MMPMTNGLHDLREEILEAVWMQDEGGPEAQTALCDRFEAAQVRTEFARLTAEGLLRGEDRAHALTAGGRQRARHVVRANRLAARLLADVLELPPALIAGQACRLEHAIGPLLADTICTLLGHPPAAPDGRPIPPGDCCGAAHRVLAPAVVPLLELKLGATGRVTFIRPRVKESLEQLADLGLLPGAQVRLRQQRPSVVLDIGETTLALDKDVARDIYVKPA